MLLFCCSFCRQQELLGLGCADAQHPSSIIHHPSFLIHHPSFIQAFGLRMPSFGYDIGWNWYWSVLASAITSNIQTSNHANSQSSHHPNITSSKHHIIAHHTIGHRIIQTSYHPNIQTSHHRTSHHRTSHHRPSHHPNIQSNQTSIRYVIY